MALTPRQKKARRLWKMRALGLGYEDGGGGGGGSLTEQVIAFFAGGEEGGVWDFTDAANLATATDGTGTVSNGSLIAYCADLSGNNNHLTQATSGSRPTWNSAGYASFATDYIFSPTWPAAIQPTTRASRLYTGSWANGGRLISGPLSEGRHVLFQTGSSPKVSMLAGTISAGVNMTLSAYQTIYEVYNGASSNLRLNGTDNTVNPGTGSIAGVSIGGDPEAGAGAHPSLRMVRVMAIDRSLTAGELAIVEAWLEEVL